MSHSGRVMSVCEERMFCFIQYPIPLSNRLVKDIAMYSESFLEKKTNVISLSCFSEFF